MITVKIKIWKFQELLHEGNYQFETMREATNYQIGLFNGMNLMGAEATGMGLEPVTNEDEILYVLGEDSINGIDINEKIPGEELFEYRITDRAELIDDLTRWISEGSKDKELMRADLKMLMNIDDDYIFSSISTNEYITKSCPNFNETCKELLELNESL